MFSNLSKQDESERDSIIKDIFAAFAHVTRGEGTSWSETVAIDNWESDEACEAARRSDKDRKWTELVDNPEWRPFPGIGGFSFIDAVGFRYYLPPTMIRFLRGDNTEWFPGHLLRSINRLYDPELWSAPEARATARFISFMARHDDEVCLNPDEPNPWAEALESTWSRFLA